MCPWFASDFIGIAAAWVKPIAAGIRRRMIDKSSNDRLKSE
jgi:hypothetical protein